MNQTKFNYEEELSKCRSMQDITGENGLVQKIQEFIKKYKLEHMTVYGFRHSFATLMSEQGMDREVLRELMGHSEFETTDFYYIHISEERKKREFERVHKEMSEKEIPQNKGKRFVLKRKVKNLKFA